MFGRLMLYYGNVTPAPLANFSVSPVPHYGHLLRHLMGVLQVSIAPHSSLLIQVQATPPQIDGGVQIQQPLVVTCNQVRTCLRLSCRANVRRPMFFQEFFEPPAMAIQFVSNGRPVQIVIPLPLVLTKFIEPLQLSKDDFFHRWRQISCTAPPPFFSPHDALHCE
jgi:AP-2 complex subunit alpha